MTKKVKETIKYYLKVAYIGASLGAFARIIWFNIMWYYVC